MRRWPGGAQGALRGAAVSAGGKRRPPNARKPRKATESPTEAHFTFHFTGVPVTSIPLYKNLVTLAPRPGLEPGSLKGIARRKTDNAPEIGLRETSANPGQSERRSKRNTAPVQL